ncbi:MAG: hypothetical protein ACKESC_01785 [Candidatus Hodgkinia cicadicola]
MFRIESLFNLKKDQWFANNDNNCRKHGYTKSQNEMPPILGNSNDFSFIKAGAIKLSIPPINDGIST